MIPYGKQCLDKSDYKSVLKVLKSDYITQGPTILKFEEEIAQITKSKYAVAISSGTTALHLAYLVANLKPGDEVITTPNTFVATTNMALLIGAKPVFCDIRSDTYNIDESKIESLITSKTKIIVPVHFAGHPCNMEKIWDIASRHNLIVIEDATHALGASYQNIPIGGGKSAMTIFSFHPVKPITTGEGGAIVTNNLELYKKLKHLRSHGIIKDKNGFNVMTELGYNYRLADINAALGLSQLSKLKKFISLRQKVANQYQEELKNLSEIIIPTETANTHPGWHLYIIRVKNPTHRLPLMDYLRSHGIGINFHYPAVYSHPYYRAHGYSNFSLPFTDSYSATAITLPIYPHLTKSEVITITEAIKNFFNLQSSYINSFNQLARLNQAGLREGHLFSFRHNLAFKTAKNIIHLLKPKGLLLDLGGGTGEIARHLAPLCDSLTIADGATNALSVARQNLSNFSNINFIYYDLIKDLFPFKSKEFNCILCYSVIQYLENENQLQTLLDKLIDSLIPGGRLLIGDIPFPEKMQNYLTIRRRRPLYHFIKNLNYIIKLYITKFIYKYKKITTISNLKPLILNEQNIRSYLDKYTEIQYNFLEQPDSLEHSGSRIDILITKSL